MDQVWTKKLLRTSQGPGLDQGVWYGVKWLKGAVISYLLRAWTRFAHIHIYPLQKRVVKMGQKTEKKFSYIYIYILVQRVSK